MRTPKFIWMLWLAGLIFRLFLWLLKETECLKEVFAADLLDGWDCPEKQCNHRRVPVEEPSVFSFPNSRLTEAGGVGGGDWLLEGCARWEVVAKLWSWRKGGADYIYGIREDGKRIESVLTETLQRWEPECPDRAKQGNQSLWAVLI